MIFQAAFARRLALGLLGAIVAVLLVMAAFGAGCAAWGGTVRFTPTTTGMKSPLCCAPDTVHLHGCYAAVLYAFGQQSPTWASKGRACLADPVLWAQVVLQAAPRQVSSKALCPPFTALDSLPYPDSLAGRCAYLVTRNSAGGFCWGRVIKLP